MFRKWGKTFLISVIVLWTISGAGASWVGKASMPTPRRAPGAVEVNEKIYVIGGCGGSISNEEYNPATNSWVTKGSLSWARRRGMGAVACEVNGKVYFIGGQQGPSPIRIVNFNDEYDPVSNLWTNKASMPTARVGAAAFVVNGKIYVIGGYDGSSFLDIVEEYDPATNSWKTKTPMPTPRAFLAGAVVDDNIYVIGGFNGSCLDIVQEYDPVGDLWATKTSMPTERYWLAAEAVAGKIYVIGGYDGTSCLTSNEVYDPALDSWSTEVSMPTARSHLVAVEVNDKIYAIGGVIDGGSFTGANEEFTPSGGVEGKPTAGLPEVFSLSQNYPNPFNPITKIKYSLPTGDWVKLEVYDILGHEVATLVNQYQNAGQHSVQWKAEVISGIYFYRIHTGEYVATGRMVLIQ